MIEEVTDLTVFFPHPCWTSVFQVLSFSISICELFKLKVEFGINFQVLEMEKDVLKFLNFEIYTPTTKNFLRQV
jgi:hypothetical protein